MCHRTIKPVIALGLFLLTYASHSFAHEYWLDPIDHTLTPGDSAVIDIRNGQDFRGSALLFNRQRYQSVLVANATDTKAYSGRLGDYPALHPELDSEGVYSVSLETTHRSLTYESWDKFTEFLSYHGFKDEEERHLERGLPKDEIIERYYRYAKTFVLVNASGSTELASNNEIVPDTHKAFAPTGSVFEMLLLGNPYSQDNEISIKLLFDSKPLANRQAEMFWKNASKVQRYVTETNDEGIASFELQGDGDYLLNAVQLSEPTVNDFHWLSYWASITFER